MKKSIWGCVITGLSLLLLSTMNTAIAEGRMYVPKEDPPVKMQLCRLYKIDRDETSTSCRYRPQNRDDDVVVTTEDPRIDCQRDFLCKIIK